jgi:outer membrane protein OmpA-like peptidoglycan-associated protein
MILINIFSRFGTILIVLYISARNSFSFLTLRTKKKPLVRIFLIYLLFSMPLYGIAQHGLQKLPRPINSDEFDEICPVMSYDESYLFFTRVGDPNFNKSLIENGNDLSKVLSEKGYWDKLNSIYSEISGQNVTDVEKSDFNQDIWMAKIEGEKVFLHHPVLPINNALPNSICSNYSKRNEYVVINEFPPTGGIKAGFSYVKMMDDGRFTIPTPIKIKNFRSQGTAVNLSMSNDGQQIFISMESANGAGGKDLFVSIKVLNNLYSPPVNLGRVVNSEYSETTPFISQDKNRLYFASDRPGGFGKMDIYYCDRIDYTYKNWSEPKLLEQPINSVHDDSHPYIFVDENTIFFTSDRDGTSDIFSALLYEDEVEDRPLGVNITIYNEKGEIIQGELYWKEANEDKKNGFFRTNTGQYRYVIEDNIPMLFYSRRRGTFSEPIKIDPIYYKRQKIFDVDIDLILPAPKYVGTPIKGVQVTEAKKPDIVREEVVEELLPIEKNRTIILKNIYFEKSKPKVLNVSHPALRQLANVLKKRPQVKIRIEGHTDNVGNKKDLMTLSWDRAEAVKDFLVNEGVKVGNVLTRGFGPNRPLTDNSTEEARKKNRRVEIRILEQ